MVLLIDVFICIYVYARKSANMIVLSKAQESKHS